MNLRPFQIEINRHPPFIGLFESSSAALDAFHALAAAEARIGNGFRLGYSPIDLKEKAMPVLNDRALRPLYRKAGRALGQLNQRIDRWTRRYPTTTAVLFALLGWVLLWLAHRGAICT